MGSPDDPISLHTRATHGDRAALDPLLVRYLPELRAFVRLRSNRLLRQRESYSDIVQSVCREVLQRAATVELRDEKAFRNWLFGAVLNKVRDRQKYHLAEKRHPQRESPHPLEESLRAYQSLSTPCAAAASREAIEAIEAAFDKLPDHYREVITLSRIVGLSSAQIGEAMGRTDKAVRALLSRALVQLARLLDDDGQSH